MDYNLFISERADQLFENCLRYLIYKLKNEQAAVHFLNETEKIYDRLRRNPYQFPQSRDLYLQRQGYREAVYGEMDYLIIFRIEDRTVYVLGVFHQLEEYRKKLR